MIGGAIGDALGGYYEGMDVVSEVSDTHRWLLSDDTQLTLATCEAIAETAQVDPSKIAERMLFWYNKGRLSGLGSSTLKALRELQMGGHWALVGRQGAFAAGNGAAMRIAPLAFKSQVDRFTLQDVCSITHKNDEAYCGALAQYTALGLSLTNSWSLSHPLCEQVVKELPDCAVRDRLNDMIEGRGLSIAEMGKRYPSSGYVVDSVPLAIFAAGKMGELNFAEVLYELIKVGGDTDTLCSMAGQVMASFGGLECIPETWHIRFSQLRAAPLIDRIVQSWQP